MKKIIVLVLFVLVMLVFVIPADATDCGPSFGMVSQPRGTYLYDAPEGDEVVFLVYERNVKFTGNYDGFWKEVKTHGGLYTGWVWDCDVIGSICGLTCK